MASTNKKKFRAITPTILQMEATECGSTCLGIVLAYYEKYIAIDELREVCGVSREGSKAVNILKAARNYQMEANGVNLEMHELAELHCPAILFWGFDHFVVLEGVSDDIYYINDPAIGPRELDAAEFSKYFTGVAIELTPTKKFTPNNKRPNIVKDILADAKKHYNNIIYIISVSLALLVPGIIIPGFSKIFIDNIMADKMHDWFLPFITGMICIVILKVALTWLQKKYLLKLFTGILVQHTARFVWHILHLPVKFFSQRLAGDLIDKIYANERIAEILSAEINSAVVNGVAAVFYFMIICLLSFKLACLGLLAIIINTQILVFLSRRIENVSRRVVQSEGKLYGTEMHAVKSLETLKAMGADDDFFVRRSGMHAGILNANHYALVYNSILEILPELVTTLNRMLILVIGAVLVMRGEITIGTLVAIQMLIENLYSPIMTLLSVGVELQEVKGDFARIVDVRSYKKDVRYQIEAQKNTQLPRPADLQVKNIEFGYGLLDEPTVKGISFMANPGDLLTIIGKSGSGKSTLVKLLCGLYQPWKGSVHVGGYNLQEISPEIVAKDIAYVDQVKFLYKDTIRNNLTMWDDTVPENKIFSVLDDVGMLNLVVHRGGIDIPIAEGGKDFSGGQRQLLEIARALILEPKILFLDEATSAVDLKLEARLLDKLSEKNITTVLVTHKLNVVSKSDFIVVMQKGEIAAKGRHKQLMKESDIYKQLITSGRVT